MTFTPDTLAPAWVLRLTGLIAVLAICGLLLGAGIIVADVLGRWLFGRAVVALNEIMSVVFALAVAATLPAGAARRVNLKVDLLGNSTGARMTAWLAVLGTVLLGVFFALLAWRIWGLALRYNSQGRSTSILFIPLAPLYFAVAGLMASAAAVQVVLFVQDLRHALAVRGGARTGPVTLVLLAVLGALVLGLAGWAWADWSSMAGFVTGQPGAAVGLAFALLWLCVLAQLPLATITALIGVSAATFYVGWRPAGNVMAQNAMEFMLNFQVATLPMFMMMGSFAVAAGISTDLYRLANAILGGVRGGLAYATVAGCAAFGAVSGSSVATAATFGRLALPEMKRHGYAASLSTGTVAAGGTLGALVPPSGAIILFALLTEQSIAQLFAAALVPAGVAMLLYFAAIFVSLRLNPAAAPQGVRRDHSDLIPATIAALPVMALFAVVLGGLYGGVFTATESAAVGAVGAFILALARGRLTRATLLQVFSETTATTAMVYALIFGALMLSFFIDLGRTPEMVALWITGLDLRPVVILALLLIFYLVLGSVMDSFAIMVITVPVITPLVVGMGYDILLWGVLMLVVVETGMITPPFGIHLFLIKSLQPDTPLSTVIRGVSPFIVADLLKIVLLVAIPALSLWLPSVMI